MVSRYREEAATHGFGRQALIRTLQTAGRTILFSSLTVAAAIASLAIFPQRFLYSMGIAGALVALIAAALALLVLPALLAVLGPRVNALAPKRLQRAADRDARPAQAGFWYRLSRLVMRRPAADRRDHRSWADRGGHPVREHQVHHGQRRRPASHGERTDRRRNAQHRVPAESDLARRGCRRRTGKRAASQGAGRRDQAASGRVRDRCAAAGRARHGRCSKSPPRTRR